MKRAPDDVLALLEPMTDNEWREHMATWPRYRRWTFIAVIVVLGTLLRGRRPPDHLS